MLPMDDELKQIIAALQMSPLPFEGGWFSQTYRSQVSLSESMLPPGYSSDRWLSTAIYYLMTPAPDGFSAMHRLRGVEILHFYRGEPVETLLLYPDGSVRHCMVGPDVLLGQQPQLVIPAGVWQGHRVRSGGRYTLIGSTMAPGYDDADFELGERAALCRQYPDCADLITKLTRN